MSVSDFTNVFGEPATSRDLGSIFDTINVNNDDRVSFKDFIKVLENVGISGDSISREELRQAFDDICSCDDSGNNSSNICKSSFLNGVKLSTESANIRDIYSKILGGGQYDAQKGRTECDLDEIRDSIDDKKDDWQHRILCMQSLVRLMTDNSMTLDRFHSMFRTFHECFLKQSGDRRTQVMRVACESLAKIVRKWKADFVRYANKTIDTMMESVRQKIEITHISGAAVIRCILRNVPDSRRLRIMETIGEEAVTSKFQDLKADCFEFLCLYFEKQTEDLKNEDAFWDKLIPYCESGVKDVANVRDNALWLLALIQVERHDLAFPITKAMGAHLKARYESDYRNQRPDFTRGSGAAAGSNNNNNNSNNNNNDQGDAKVDSPRPKKKDSLSVDNDEKESKGGGKLHERKRSWTNRDLVIGLEKMEQLKAQKQSENRHKRTKSKKSKKSSKYPIPRDGEFWNPFYEPIDDRDLKYAFDLIDIKNDRRITLDEFQAALRKLDINVDYKDCQSYFDLLDLNSCKYIEYDIFKQAYLQKHIVLRTFWLRLLSASHLETTRIDGDLELEDISKLLRDTNGDWEQRVLAIHSYVRILNGKNMSDGEKFIKNFRRMVGNLCSQVKDRRSAVMRETCIAFSKIMVSKRANFLKFAPRVLETLYECIRIKIEIVSVTAQQCARVMVKYVPDSKKFPLFEQIVKGACDKQFAAVRLASFGFINDIFIKMIRKDSNRPTKFWDLAHIAFKSGLHDADSSVRDLAYEVVARAEVVNQKQASKHLGDLSKAAKKKFADIRAKVLEQIANQDWKDDALGDDGLLISLKDIETESVGSSSNGTGLGSPTSPRSIKGDNDNNNNDSIAKHKKTRSPVISPTIPHGDIPSISSHRSVGSNSSVTSNGGGSGSKKKLKDRTKSKGSIEAKPIKTTVAKNLSRKDSNASNTSGVSNDNSKKKTGGATAATVSSTAKHARNNNSKASLSSAASKSTTSDKKDNKKKPSAKLTTASAGSGDDSSSNKKKTSPTSSKKKPKTEQNGSGSGGSGGSGSNNNGNSLKDARRSSRTSVGSAGKGVRSTAKADARAYAVRLDKKLLIAGNMDILEAFESVDADNDGFIEFEAFRVAMKEIGLKPQRGDAVKAFAEVTDDGKELIDLNEFVEALHICNPQFNLFWKLINTNNYQNIEPENDSDTPSLENCKIIMGDKRSHWKQRVNSMRWAVWLMLDNKKKDQEIGLLIKKVFDGFTAAIKSEEQIIVREACISIGRISRARKGALSKVVGRFLKTCWEVIDTINPLISYSVSQCMKCVIRWVPDSSENRILKTLIQGSKLKGFNEVRNSCFECIAVMIKRAGKQSTATVTNDFWTMIREVLSDSLQSAEADHDILQMVFKCLLGLENISDSKTHRLIENMDANTKQEWLAFKENPQAGLDSTNNNNTNNNETKDEENDDIPDTSELIVMSQATTTENTEDEDTPPAAASGAQESKEKEKVDVTERIWSTTFDGHKQELSEMFDEYDVDGLGYLNVEQCKNMLRELGQSNGKGLDIAIRGLDKKRNGQILKDDVIYWCFHKTSSHSMYPNQILENESIQFGWLSSRLSKLEKRKELIVELREMDLNDHNYNGVYDWDIKLAVLDYLIAKAERLAKKSKKNKSSHASMPYVRKLEYVFY